MWSICKQTTANELAYTGGVYDKTTEEYYLNARYYDPKDGRFLTQDTYRGEDTDTSTWNLYSYCGSNPVNYVDPSGHIFDALAAWASGGLGLCAVDGPVPVGDVIYGAGLLVLGAMSLYMTISASQFRRRWNDSCSSIGSSFRKSLEINKVIAIGTFSWTAVKAKDISKSLEKSFEKAISKGKIKKGNSEVHHIVAKKAGRAKDARDVLKKVNIKIESNKNKVRLKYGLHRRLHTILYYKFVNSVILRAYDRNGSEKTKKKRVEGALNSLKNMLKTFNTAAPF